MYNEAAGHFAAMLFQQRMRAPADREFVSQTFRAVWGHPLPDVGQQAVTVTPTRFSIGRASLQRSSAGDQHAMLHVPCVAVRQATTIGSTLDLAFSGGCLFLKGATSSNPPGSRGRPSGTNRC